MDSKVFLEWFQRKFVAHVKQFCHEIGIECKILLLLDNAPAHPSADKLQSQDRTVTTMFLSANTISLVQPMDQGIIESVKRRYKKLLLRHLILEEKTSHLSIPAVLKELTIKHAVYWAAQAWSETSTDCLSRGWNNSNQMII